MTKIKQKIEKWIEGLVLGAIKDAKIEERVGIAIEKLRYDYLPHGACWLCSMPVSRKGGYQMWRGKMFCTENCLRKYRGLTQQADDTHKVLDGDPIEVFSPSTPELLTK